MSTIARCGWKFVCCEIALPTAPERRSTEAEQCANHPLCIGRNSTCIIFAPLENTRFFEVVMNVMMILMRDSKEQKSIGVYIMALTP